ncbi:MAG: flagellar hook-basal body complex protein FliE [Proteocatella sp.]
MFIDQMQKISSITDIAQVGKSQNSKLETQGSGGENLFKDIFNNALNSVVETDKEVMQQQYMLATGQTDDIHNLTIASTKAQLSVDLMVQLRNKAMESYSEITRINM